MTHLNVVFDCWECCSTLTKLSTAEIIRKILCLLLGHLIGPVICHTFCNFMGFPVIDQIPSSKYPRCEYFKNLSLSGLPSLSACCLYHLLVFRLKKYWIFLLVVYVVLFYFSQLLVHHFLLVLFCFWCLHCHWQTQHGITLYIINNS